MEQHNKLEDLNLSVELLQVLLPEKFMLIWTLLRFSLPRTSLIPMELKLSCSLLWDYLCTEEEIRKEVKGLRKHSSRRVRSFARKSSAACSSPHSNMSDFHVQHRPMAVESKPSHDNVSPLPTPSASRQLRQRLEAFGVRTAMQALTGQQRQEETIPKKRLTLIMRRNRQQDHHRINRTTQNWTSQLYGPYSLKPKAAGEIDVSGKLLLAKRKVAEGYRQINGGSYCFRKNGSVLSHLKLFATPKKQRTVQALDLKDLPKGGPISARPPQALL
ncbi:hypothetical protein R1sor_003699 [Riccia sorocarpa]|uniref:Uncharacterized protein n=1 Tax=Riccia sorocarpa TaxID=122646 RepID=A0ABD3H555_9MARC